MKFNFRINDLEVRSCNQTLTSSGDHVTAEIIQWYENESCASISRWKKDKEGYELHFIGSRPFNVNYKTFMKLAEQGQQMLDDEFNNT